MSPFRTASTGSPASAKKIAVLMAEMTTPSMMNATTRRPTTFVACSFMRGFYTVAPMEPGALATYERRFRRAGLPLFIEDYSAAGDVFTRAAPLLTLVFIAEMLGAISLDWSLAANIAAAVGGLAILLGVW